MAEHPDPRGQDEGGPPRPDERPRGWWRRWVEPLTAEQRALTENGYGWDLREAAGARGWTVRDTEPELAPLLRGAPLRLTAEHLAAPVVRGRSGSWDVTALEVRYRMPKGDLAPAQYAVTAMAVPLPLPALRIAPRRFLSHGTAGLLVLPTDDETFESRWRVLAAADAVELRGISGPRLRAALVAGPDLDELWTAGGYLAVSRAGAHHGTLLADHTRLLDEAMAGLQAAL